MSNEKDEFIFKRQQDEYKTLLSPYQEYLKQAVTYVKKQSGLDDKEAKKVLKKILKKHNPKNPVVKYRQKQDNGDTLISTSTLTDYISESIEKNEIIVPSFTTYVHPSKTKSLHAEFLETNINLRKQDKANMFKYEQLGDKDKSIHYETLQKVRKIFNNSVSGSYASKSTILCNPSAHYTLTSITRVVASIGNAVTENMVAGNKHFKDIDSVYNYITAVITNIHKNGIEYIINKYKLYLPSPEDVMGMILYSSRLYWTDVTVEKDILNYLKKLTPYELASVLYVNDLFHLKKHNEEFVRDMLGRISKKVTTGSINNLKDINNASEGVMNLVHHICSEEIKGQTINYSEMTDTPELMLLASTARNITKEFNYYKVLFKTLYTTDILPIGIAHIRGMYRDAITLSDTDSTCGSYDQWVKWYFGNTKVNSDSIGIAATVMTINIQAIDHNLKIFTKNMNVDSKLVELIKMKNEFFWTVFTPTNVSKHYFANTIIREGNVFKEPKLELKGIHLIASAIDQDIAEVGDKLILDIHNKVEKGEKIIAREYIDLVVNLETKLIDSIKKGEINVYKKDKIKSEKSYKLEASLSPYFHHLLWNNVFKDKYGEGGIPEYNVIKIPTTLNSKKAIAEFIDKIEDKSIANKLREFLSNYKKDRLGTFRVPIAIAISKGIPVELTSCVDYKRIVKDNLYKLYMILETIGIYRKPSLLFSEMGY